jgi:RNA polymerase sigma-70 factor (ECF subfamily)
MGRDDDACGSTMPVKVADQEQPWIAAAQQGDADAFGRLYDRHVDVVWRYVYRRVASRNDAEDLVSETFLRALRGIGGFRERPGGGFAAWLTTIAGNLVRDFYKSSAYRAGSRTVGLEEYLVAADADPRVDPCEVALVNDALDVIVVAIGWLSVGQRACVRMRYFQGLSVEETAWRLGLNESATKALAYRGLRVLHRRVTEMGLCWNGLSLTREACP